MSEKYLIFKGNGGLKHNLTSLCLAIDVCHSKNRTLIIDMNKHVAFGIHFSSIFVIKGLPIKYYDTYDHIPNTLFFKEKSVKEISETGIRFYNNAYHIFGFNVTDIEDSDDDIILFSKFSNKKSLTYRIEVNDDIYRMLKNENPIKEDYIGIHFRNTDIKNDISLIIASIRKIDIPIIYLATDYSETLEILRKEFPDKTIISYTNPPKDIINLHYHSKNKFEQMYNCLRDIYFLAKSTYFIPSYNSGFSSLIIDLIRGNNTIIPNIESKTIIL